MAGAVVLTTSGRTSEKESGAAALTFHRYGDSYFLSSIRNGFTGIANTVPATRREEELRRTATEQKFEVTAYLARR